MGFSVTTVQKALKGADYPATGEELADLAEGNGADQDLVDALREIGDAESPADVMTEMQDQLGDDDDED